MPFRPSVVLATLALAAAAAHAQPANERAQDRWNLEALYATTADFDADLATMEADLPRVAACKGTLGESAARLKACMDLRYDVLRRSIAAGSLFADDILAGVPGARERYLGLLSAGGSDYPYELVKAAGVDLATPAPYNAIAARMNRIMDQIETIAGKPR